MASGKTHDRLNSIATFGTICLGLVLKSDPVIITGLGIGLGTVYLSPDLDLAKSNPTNRLGPFKLFLGPYRAMCGHHRSWVSHSPVVSNLIRVAYFMSPIVIFCIYKGYDYQLAKVVLSKEFFYALVGLEIATNLHLFLDWQYSYFKGKVKHGTR